MVEPAAATAIVEGLRARGCPLPITMALGELFADAEPVVARRLLPRGLWLAKVGFAGVRETAGWQAGFADLVRRCRDHCPVIPAAYADWERARAPTPDELLALAEQHESPFLLLDTWKKDRPLWDWLGPDELSKFVEPPVAGVDIAARQLTQCASIATGALNEAALVVTVPQHPLQAAIGPARSQPNALPTQGASCNNRGLG